MTPLLGRLRDFWLGRSVPSNPPFRLWVEITSRCNLACTQCAHRLLPKENWDDMDPGLLESLAGQIKGWNVEVNLFHRGEPLLHPELPFWIKRFRQNARLVRIHTNATLLDQERIAGLLWAKPDFLTLSIDSLDPAQYAAGRQGAELGRTLAGVKSLLKAKSGIGSARPFITLLTMGNDAPGRDHPLLRELFALGLDKAVHREPHNWGGATGMVEESYNLARCTFPWYGLCVLNDGRVTPCPQDFSGELCLGNTHDRPLADFWEGAEMAALRRAHAKGGIAGLSPCRNCDRIHRPTFLGIPLEHLKNFLSESIVRAPGRSARKRRADRRGN